MGLKRFQFAFTLVEMLLVVATIAVLIAMLLPALGRAKDAAKIALCASNQGQIGSAQMGYLIDSRGRFPQLSSWSGLIGTKGTSGNYSSSSLDVTQRPLNKYLGATSNGSNVNISECPSDLGDAFPSYNGSVTNCYIFYGTSYLAQWNSTAFRAAMVYGVTGGTRSISMSRITSPSNKLLMADWSWHGNRPIADRQTRWHNKGPVRQFNTLFADGRVSYFIYPVEEIDVDYTGGSYNIAPVSPGFLWW
ncbi:MAG: type II secretion system protein [Phycisphaeraceae bacterium]